MHAHRALLLFPPSAAVTTDIRDALSCMESSPLGGRLRRLYLEGKALEVIASLVDRICPGTGTRRHARTLRPREARKVRDAQDFIRGRMDDLPTVRELARAVGMSTTVFKQAWRAVLGMPVDEYVRSERLALARTLLAQGDLSVSEVADRVGYQSLSWFGIAFKRQFGTLPSEIWPRTVKDLSSTDNAIR